MTTRHRIYAGAVLAAALAGCAGPATERTLPAVSAYPSPSIETAIPAPSASSPPAIPKSAIPKSAIPKSAVPTLRPPTGPPDEPTDQIKDTGWLVGTVTSGGTGPCYGLTTDEGTPYALHSTSGANLAKGSRIRVRTKTALVRIYCGPGRLLEMTAAEPLG